MSSEEQGLLQDIAKNPADDTPRLVYADWLEERCKRQDPSDPDYARAQFIRIQIKLAKEEDLPRREQALLLGQQRELLTNNRAEWAALPEALSNARMEFHRGFPEHITMTADQFLENAGELPATITSLHLTDAQDHVQALTALPRLAELTRLDLGGNHIDDEGARALARSPHLAKLFSLDLSFNDIGNEGAQALARSPHLSKLIRLDLSHNLITETVRHALVSGHTVRITGRIRETGPGMGGLGGV